MIVIVAAFIGAIVGGITAKRRSGNKLDIAQYATGFGMAFIVVSLIATVVLERIIS